MGQNTKIKSIGLALVTTSLLSTSAIAGGFDRGGVNIDQLFDEGRFGVSAQVTYVNPQRTIKNVTRPGLALLNPTAAAAVNGTSVDNEGDFVVPRIGAKFNVANGLDCLASYSEPFGGDANYGTGNNYSPSTVEFFLDTQDYGLTCGYQHALGDVSLGGVTGESFLRLIGGVSYMEVQGFLSRESLLFGTALPNPGFDPNSPPSATNSPVIPIAPQAGALGTFSIEDETFGWRAGIAYEVPSIALKASVVYNSRYDLSLTGIQDTTAFTNLGPGATLTPILLSGAEIPQSLDVKLQTGINETTLAFLNFRWQDWSQLQILPVINTDTGTPTGSTLDASFRDGYTVSVGVGKTITEKLSGLASLTWDDGTSTIVGTQSDTWTLSGGLRYTENEQLSLNIGGAIGILEGGKSGINPNNPDPSGAVTFEFDADVVYAISGGLNYKF